MQTDKSPKIEFQIPEGFSIPEGADASKPFDVVCSVKLTGKGRGACLTQFGDIPMPGAKDDYKAQDEEQEPQYKPGYENPMAGQGGGDDEDQEMQMQQQ